MALAISEDSGETWKRSVILPDVVAPECEGSIAGTTVDVILLCECEYECSIYIVFYSGVIKESIKSIQILN